MTRYNGSGIPLVDYERGYYTCSGGRYVGMMCPRGDVDSDELTMTCMLGNDACDTMDVMPTIYGA